MTKKELLEAMKKAINRVDIIAFELRATNKPVSEELLEASEHLDNAYERATGEYADSESETGASVKLDFNYDNLPDILDSIIEQINPDESMYQGDAHDMQILADLLSCKTFLMSAKKFIVSAHNRIYESH